jgi:hypothetical protein
MHAVPIFKKKCPNFCLLSLGLATAVSTANPSINLTAESLAAAMPQFKETGDFELIPPKLDSRDLDLAIKVGISTMTQSHVSIPKMAEESPAEFIGKELRRRISAGMSARFPNPNQTLLDWAVAEAVCEYVKRTVRYDYELAAITDAKTKTRRSSSKEILAPGCMKAVCWGYAVTTRDIARAAGLRCYLVNGNALVNGRAPAYEERNHSVVVFDFDGFEVPADVSSASIRYQGSNGETEFGTNRKSLTQYILPRDRFSWNLFLARFNAQVSLRPEQKVSGDEQNKWLKTKYGYDEWASLDIRSLTTKENDYIIWERGRRS